MNIAIVLAGGVGSRMNSKETPKQFLLVAGKPIIIYTLEKFEESNLIDKIVIVCKQGYEEELKNYIAQVGITKVSSIVCGGESRQDSLYAGVKAANEISNNSCDDIVVINDAVRPNLSQDLISDLINQTLIHKAVIVVGRPIETIVLVNDMGFVNEVKNRSICRTSKGPHAYNLSLLTSIFEKSQIEGKKDYTDDESMMYDNGVPLFTILCNESNIKITTRMDYIMFRSYICSLEDSQF